MHLKEDPRPQMAKWPGLLKAVAGLMPEVLERIRDVIPRRQWRQRESQSSDPDSKGQPPQGVADAKLKSC